MDNDEIQIDITKTYLITDSMISALETLDAIAHIAIYTCGVTVGLSVVIYFGSALFGKFSFFGVFFFNALGIASAASALIALQKKNSVLKDIKRAAVDSIVLSKQ
jgi:hypothetical protein